MIRTYSKLLAFLPHVTITQLVTETIRKCSIPEFHSHLEELFRFKCKDILCEKSFPESRNGTSKNAVKYFSQFSLCLFSKSVQLTSGTENRRGEARVDHKHTDNMLQNYCRWEGDDARRCSVRGNARHKHAQHNTAVLLPLQLHIDGPNVTIKQSIWDNDTCGQSISAGPLFHTIVCSTFTQGWHRFLQDVHANTTRGTKTNQQRAVWTPGWNPGSTHVHKTNTPVVRKARKDMW